MVSYQKIGVITASVAFAILQKLKLQIFRLLAIQDTCENSNECVNFTSISNSSSKLFQSAVPQFIFQCLLVNNFLSILPCILLASWSDKHGRKLLLYLPYFGSLVADVFMLVIISATSKSITLLLLAEAIYGLCGGTVLMAVGCMCYVTDTTDHRMRTWYIGLYLGLLNVLPLTERVLQYYITPVHTHLDFRALLTISIVCRMCIGIVFLLYLKACVVESVFILGTFGGNPWVNLLTPINITDTVNCVFKRRLDNLRFYIIALSTIFTFYSLCLYGNLTAFPRHFSHVFHWSHKDLMAFLGIFTAAQIAVLWISSYASVKCRYLDIDLGIFGSISLAVSCFAMTFIKDSWIAIIGTLVGSASLLVPASVISVLSKLIERAETGSMYAGIGFLMLLTQLVAVPSYEALDKISTEAGIPNIVFLLSLGFASFGMLFFVYLKKNISPDLLGHLNCSESLTLINRKGQIENIFD